MEHLKNFESFVNEQNINEAKVSKSDVKKLQKRGYDAEMFGKDEIVVNDGPNHWDDNNVYTYYWDGERVTSAADGEASGDAEYTKVVKTVDEFIKAMETTKDWE